MTQPAATPDLPDSLPDTLPPPHALDAQASCPRRLGWMQGSPPPLDKQVRFADGSSGRFPQMRWSFSHYRQLQPTQVVSRGPGGVCPLPRADRSDLDDLQFIPLGARRPVSLAQSLDANYTDGIVVLHQGRIVYERYFGVLQPERQHIAFSVTKSFVGTLGASLLCEGLLDDSLPVTHWVPELAASGWGDASLRQVMDMTTGIDCSDAYTDPRAGVFALLRAGGLLPRPADYAGPDSLCAFLTSVAKLGEHGQGFTYRTANTDVLAWVLQRATGLGLAELLSQRIWQGLGAEQDAYITSDPQATPFAGGGMNTALRDLARFGEAMRCDGAFNGRQIVPAAAVADIRRGGDPAHFAQAGYQLLPGWSYRHMWWVTHNAHGAYMARGVHGQCIYIDPLAQMVVARFASHPMAANVHLDPSSLPAWHALALHLLAHPTSTRDRA